MPHPWKYNEFQRGVNNSEQQRGSDPVEHVPGSLQKGWTELTFKGPHTTQTIQRF